MDASTQTFIGQLRDIRSTLRDANRLAAGFEFKMLGPRPEQKADNPKPVECVASILSEIQVLSTGLAKSLAHHHDVFGDVGLPECIEGPNAPTNRYA